MHGLSDGQQKSSNVAIGSISGSIVYVQILLQQNKSNRIGSPKKNESGHIVAPLPLQNKTTYKNKSDRIASAKIVLTIWIDLYRNICSNDFNRWKILYIFISKNGRIAIAYSMAMDMCSQVCHACWNDHCTSRASSPVAQDKPYWSI